MDLALLARGAKVRDAAFDIPRHAVPRKLGRRHEDTRGEQSAGRACMAVGGGSGLLLREQRVEREGPAHAS